VFIAAERDKGQLAKVTRRIYSWKAAIDDSVWGERLCFFAWVRARARGRIRMVLLMFFCLEFAMNEALAGAFPETVQPVHLQGQNRRKDKQHTGLENRSLSGMLQGLSVSKSDHKSVYLSL
jgi:hypothetical protein